MNEAKQITTAIFHFFYHSYHLLGKHLVPLVNLSNMANVIIAGVALYFAWRTFWLTRGHEIVTERIITYGVGCSPHVSTLIIENRKNRPEIITEIHMMLGYQYAIELKKYEADLLILKPLEAVIINLDPVSWYLLNGQVVNAGKLLMDKKIKKKIQLTTTRGVVKTRDNKQGTHLIVRFFKNYCFGYIHVWEQKNNGVTYTMNSEYLVRIESSNKKIVNYLIDKSGKIHPDIFGKYSLRKSVLESEESLRKYLTDELTARQLNDSKVVDVTRLAKPDKHRNYELQFLPRWVYFLVGPIWAKADSFKAKWKRKDLS
tara:strand:- start:6437 stop:7381 length:945 start_codon:yes stop_codon:yes gene_type:complete